ncbi:unnamed protein product [Trichogramma brassicae]|uniref:Uncharacterized protein n=1 Tax=Trichogramma brassicae TaxID=86971 RepID=A0A6H5ID94_9HYME|nr:unnamed protein product [Trichogramma brassicae]
MSLNRISSKYIFVLQHRQNKIYNSRTTTAATAATSSDNESARLIDFRAAAELSSAGGYYIEYKKALLGSTKRHWYCFPALTRFLFLLICLDKWLRAASSSRKKRTCTLHKRTELTFYIIYREGTKSHNLLEKLSMREMPSACLALRYATALLLHTIYLMYIARVHDDYYCTYFRGSELAFR